MTVGLRVSNRGQAFSVLPTVTNKFEQHLSFISASSNFGNNSRGRQAESMQRSTSALKAESLVSGWPVESGLQGCQGGVGNVSSCFEPQIRDLLSPG